MPFGKELLINWIWITTQYHETPNLFCGRNELAMISIGHFVAIAAPGIYPFPR